MTMFPERLQTREETLRAHMNGAGPQPSPVTPATDSEPVPTFEIAVAAFILAVAALGVAIYVAQRQDAIQGVLKAAPWEATT